MYYPKKRGENGLSVVYQWDWWKRIPDLPADFFRHHEDFALFLAKSGREIVGSRREENEN